MTGLLLILLLVAIAYAVWVYDRSANSTIAVVAKEDWGQLRALTGGGAAPPAGLFGPGGRSNPPPGPAPKDPPVRVRGTRSGPAPGGRGRRPNAGAPCWLCGQPMTPGHKHD